MKFRQCIMERTINGQNQITTSWLPEKYAILNKIVKLKNRATEEWSDGWIVKNVSSMFQEKEEVIERSRDYDRQRKHSDI